MIRSMIKGSPSDPAEHIFEMAGKKSSKKELERAHLRGEKYVEK